MTWARGDAEWHRIKGLTEDGAVRDSRFKRYATVCGITLGTAQCAEPDKSVPHCKACAEE